MRKYFTDGSENLPASGATEKLWIYNGLDCCVTLEVLNAVKPQLNEVTSRVYDFARALQAPILEMECRGLLVDKSKRNEVYEQLSLQLKIVHDSLAEILSEGLGVENLNPSSPAQLKQLFYETLGLPPVRNRKGVTTDRKALERLRGYFQAECICNHILLIRDINKKLGVLRTGIDSDGRIRTSYNIAGTDTGRLSSYASAFGSGTNLQNITGELRYIFVADPGKKLAYIDLEQAESRAVGAIIWNLFRDGRYLDACESGDLHTMVCQLCWQDLPWTSDPSENKLIAKQPFYRHFDYRDAAKRLGHATNYFGKPPHIAKEVHIPQPLVEQFQQKYLPAFGISTWHNWVRSKLFRDGFINTFMGRHRWFFGRRTDSETIRAAIAFEPQSAVADYLNRGLFQVWRSNLVELNLQVHDAIVFQYPEEKENEIIPQVQKLLEIEIPLMHGRSFRIPTEAFVGWNWSYSRNAKKELINPDGLELFTGNDTRKRSTPTSFLHRRFS
jgi:DNA polymerase-1